MSRKSPPPKACVDWAQLSPASLERLFGLSNGQRFAAMWPGGAHSRQPPAPKRTDGDSTQQTQIRGHAALVITEQSQCAADQNRQHHQCPQAKTPRDASPAELPAPEADINE